MIIFVGVLFTPIFSYLRIRWLTFVNYALEGSLLSNIGGNFKSTQINV